jgi:hypothetical protein
MPWAITTTGRGPSPSGMYSQASNSSPEAVGIRTVVRDIAAPPVIGLDDFEAIFMAIFSSICFRDLLDSIVLKVRLPKRPQIDLSPV